ncbi:MAG: O-antigen ligase family protein [Sulfuricella sp.]|jgi:hypothetical protein
MEVFYEVFYTVLGFFFQTIPFVMAVVLALAICFFVVGSYGSPVFPVWVGMVVYVMSQLGANAALRLGLSLSLVDLYFLLLGLVVAIRLLAGHLPAQDRVARLWMLMAAVWGLLFVVGLVQFKTSAGVEFRSTFYMLASVFYLMSFRITAAQAGRIFQALYYTALALALLAAYRWGAYAMGATGDWFDPHAPLRVLDAGATMVIAVAMLPGLAMWMKLNAPRQAMMFTAPLLLIVVMVLAHRTVWIATLAALGVAWWLAGRRRKGGSAGLMVPLAVGALVLGAVFTLAPNSTVTHEFERSVAETQQKNSTIAWRLDSWKSMVDDWVAGGPLVWPAGKPFGSGNRRYIESQGMETNVAAHSHYVGMLVRGGIVVLFAYFAVQIVALRRLLSRPVAAPDWLGGELPALFIIAGMVYAISYSPDYMQALFTGLAYALAQQAGPMPSAARSSTVPFPIPVIPHASRRLTDLP